MNDLPPPPETPREEPHLESKQLSAPLRYLLIAFALVCVILGLIGAVVPGMPTTVFILMAAWAAVRSSPRLHRWLYAHRVFGPLLHNWDTGASSLLILYFSYKPWLTAMTLSIMACVLLWLWLRPEPQV